MRALLPLLLLGGPVWAAPGPLDGTDEGWRFAICQMEAACDIDMQSCGELPAPGSSYIWRDEDGLRFGGSVSAANPIDAYDSITDVLDALTPETTTEVLVTPPEHTGPGWLRLAVFQVEDGALGNRFFQMICETQDEAPPVPAFDAEPEAPSPPEVPESGASPEPVE